MANKAVKPSVLIARANARLDRPKQAPVPQVSAMSKAEVSSLSKNYDAASIQECPNLTGYSIKGHIHYRVRGKHKRLRGPSDYGPRPTKTFYQQM